MLVWSTDPNTLVLTTVSLSIHSMAAWLPLCVPLLFCVGLPASDNVKDNPPC